MDWRKKLLKKNQKVREDNTRCLFRAYPDEVFSMSQIKGYLGNADNKHVNNVIKLLLHENHIKKMQSCTREVYILR